MSNLLFSKAGNYVPSSPSPYCADLPTLQAVSVTTLLFFWSFSLILITFPQRDSSPNEPTQCFALRRQRLGWPLFFFAHGIAVLSMKYKGVFLGGCFMLVSTSSWPLNLFEAQVSGIPRKGLPMGGGGNSKGVIVSNYLQRIDGSIVCSSQCTVLLNHLCPCAQKPAPRVHVQHGEVVKPVFSRLLVLAEGGLSTILFVSSQRKYLACTHDGRPHAVANVRR